MHLKIAHFLTVSLLILLAAFQSSAQDTLTVGAIYDFRTGDEFHFKTRHDGIQITEGWLIKTITDVNTTSDSTVYTFQVIDSNRNIDTEQLVIPHVALNWTIADSIDNRKNGYKGPVDSANSIDSTYVIHAVRDTTFAGKKATYITYSDGFFDGAYFLCTYTTGLGRTKSYMSTMIGGWFFEMVYYKKGIEVWGTPVHVNDLHQSKVNVYPNPFRGQFTIAAGDHKITSLVILDNQGRQVAVLDPASPTHDIADLAPGIYHLAVAFDGHSAYVRLVYH